LMVRDRIAKAGRARVALALLMATSSNVRVATRSRASPGHACKSPGGIVAVDRSALQTPASPGTSEHPDRHHARARSGRRPRVSWSPREPVRAPALPTEAAVSLGDQRTQRPPKSESAALVVAARIYPLSHGRRTHDRARGARFRRPASLTGDHARLPHGVPAAQQGYGRGRDGPSLLRARPAPRADPSVHF
jgi:hypothetical protein